MSALSYKSYPNYAAPLSLSEWLRSCFISEKPNKPVVHTQSTVGAMIINVEEKSTFIDNSFEIILLANEMVAGSRRSTPEEDNAVARTTLRDIEAYNGEYDHLVW